MNTTSRLALLAALAGASLPARADIATAGSPPAGLVTITAPARSQVALSLPLDATTVFVGEVSSVLKRGIAWQLSPTDLVPLVGPRNALVLRFTGGRSAGLSFPVRALNAGARTASVSLELTTEDLTTMVSVGDPFEILSADTLASVFGSDARGLVTNADPDLADNVRILRGGIWQAYFHDGRAWRLRSDPKGPSRAFTVILPGQGFVLARRGASPYRLELVGRVPGRGSGPVLRRGEPILVSSPLPTAFRLADLDLRRLRDGDAAVVLRNGQWTRFVYRDETWVAGNGNATPRGPVLPVGSAVLLQRAAPGE